MSNIRTYEITHSEPKTFPIQQKDSTNYLLGGCLVLKNGRIDKVLFDGGYAQASVASATTDKFAFNFYNQDHLGNNREVVDASGAVTQVTNYYPFGAPYADASASKGADVQPYKYNGKELDLMHGLNTYDHGARQNDPILCRWDRIDPLCEDYYPYSPYNYCLDNPVKNIDPDGKVVETAWDIANAVYDVGVAIYNHIKGDHETAKSSWIDAGADAVAMIVPFVPAGTTKIVKGAKLAKRGEKASDTVKGVDKVADANHAKDLIKNGRSGRQSRLKELGDDPKLGKADRGWIKQERNQIERRKRSTIRNPKGKVLLILLVKKLLRVILIKKVNFS